MSYLPLTDVLADVAARYEVPGAAVGVLRDGTPDAAFTGVTSIDNPLPVDERTLFQIGSVSKTYAVTAVMALVSRGQVSLDQPVRMYVPELRLADESVAAAVTVRQLLNHTSGWDGTITTGAENPESSLADFVATMPGLEQLSPLGHRAEYNNAAIALAGRLVEKVTGQPYELAIRSVLLEPLGMSATYFSREDLMTERFTVGHVDGESGGFRVATPWRWPRAATPEGGIVSTVANQLRWAGFHLGDGGSIVGSAELAAMRSPTVTMVGSAMGDAIGLGWFLRDLSGTQTLGHSGATNGQYAELRLVPERDYAVVSFANGPNGPQFTQAVVETLLAGELGLRPAPRGRRPYDRARDGDVTGAYANNLSQLQVTDTAGTVALEFSLQPEAAKQMPDQPPRFAPCTVEFLDGDRGEYVIRDGAFEGLTGSFSREPSGEVTELDFGGRSHRRVDDSN